jgi:hypothetical protein
MNSRDLRAALDELGLSDGEAAQQLYITPNALWQYLQGQRKIPGPLIAAVEAWRRHGPPPGAKIVTEQVEPGKLKLMKKLRESLTEPKEPTTEKAKAGRGKKKS